MNILGSHNSWTYLPVKQWYLKPLAFIAKCQNVDIKTQYEKYGVRCFDLRVRFDSENGIVVAHGIFEYKINWFELLEQLKYLDDNHCHLRVIHEVRNKKQYTDFSKSTFIEFCEHIKKFKNIKAWCGINLYNWDFDYTFEEEPSCEENYSSVKALKLIDDWCPWLYAKMNNKEIIKDGTNKDILLIDFVNIR